MAGDVVAPPVQTVDKSLSVPPLNLSGAATHGSVENRNPVIVQPDQSNELSLFAIDIGGSLIKLVYLSKHLEPPRTSSGKQAVQEDQQKVSHLAGLCGAFPICGGCLHFVKFETTKLNECLDFIRSKGLHHSKPIAINGFVEAASENGSNQGATIKATGGGAFKYADVFKEKLGVIFDKEEEMDCLVAGANFLLRTIPYEAFTHMNGDKQFVQIDQNDLYPYLLVNIGSGVSMIKVDGEGVFERVSGTNVGGGTFWGLGRLLTKCKNFDEILELSGKGDNSKADMLVGDIYGGLDYSKIGLSATAIASSFGKVISDDKDLADCRREDLALSLLRMISYNIGQIAYLNALQHGLKRIFFGGFFIRGHAYTMNTISVAVNFWSKGEAKAMFLCHEGFVGALGAFSKRLFEVNGSSYEVCSEEGLYVKDPHT